MSPTPQKQRSRLIDVLSSAVLVALTACGPSGKSTSQVAASVNAGEITVHQVELLSQRERVMRPLESSETVGRAVLDRLVEVELAAQAARTEGLDGDPRVVQLMEVARREVLARAWQDKQSESARGPSSDEVDRYYDENPALFAQRKIYSLTDSVITAPKEKAAVLRVRIEAANSAAQFQEAVAVDGVRLTSSNLRASAEEIPLALVGKLATLRDGQSLVIARDGGLRVLSVVSAQPAPIDRRTAQPRIASFLINERKAALIKDGMLRLREQAKIDYRGPFAVLSAASAPARP